MSVRDVDRGYARLLHKLKKLKRRHSVTVGIHQKEGAESHADTPLTVAQVGAIHEFGIGVPERSFVRGYANGHAKEIQKATKKAAERSVARNGDPARELDRLGLEIAAGMQENISNGGKPPFKALAAATIAGKGSSKPLIDTGQMRQSIRHKVEKPK